MKIVVGALLLVLYLAIPWRWAGNFEAKDLNAARAADRARQVVNARIADARRVHRDLPSWRGRLRRVAIALPAAPDIGGALGQLRQASSGAGVELMSVSASPGSPIHADVRVIGSVAGVAAFLTALRDSPRLITVSSLSLAEVPTGVTLLVNAELWTSDTQVPRL